MLITPCVPQGCKNVISQFSVSCRTIQPCLDSVFNVNFVS